MRSILIALEKKQLNSWNGEIRCSWIEATNWLHGGWALLETSVYKKTAVQGRIYDWWVKNHIGVNYVALSVSYLVYYNFISKKKERKKS